MSELPKINEKAPRRRASAAKPRTKKENAVAPAAPAPRNLDVEDQLERARQAREAAAAASQPATLPPAVTQSIGDTDSNRTQTGRNDDANQTQPASTTHARLKQDATMTQTGHNHDPVLIVDATLVDVLKSVKTTSLEEFGGFLTELAPLVALWQTAKTEAAQRRHSLAILLLIKEQF